MLAPAPPSPERPDESSWSRRYLAIRRKVRGRGASRVFFTYPDVAGATAVIIVTTPGTTRALRSHAISHDQDRTGIRRETHAVAGRGLGIVVAITAPGTARALVMEALSDGEADQ